jgi:hypothetical protein
MENRKGECTIEPTFEEPSFAHVAKGACSDTSSTADKRKKYDSTNQHITPTDTHKHPHTEKKEFTGKV